jgi:hypothetical protein
MDTSNTLWQSDLSLSCAKVNDALVAKKDFSAALEAYERALIMPRYPGGFFSSKTRRMASGGETLLLRFARLRRPEYYGKRKQI